MTSGPHRHPHIQPATLPASQPRQDLRLRLRPNSPPTGYVDGGWWPRTRDLAVEMPALVRALGARLGGVTQAVFAPTAWRTAPPRIIVDGRVIRLEGLRSHDRYVVTVSGPDRQSARVLMVPPETTVAAANHAMTAAARPGNTSQPFEILVASGALPDGAFPGCGSCVTTTTPSARTHRRPPAEFTDRPEPAVIVAVLVPIIVVLTCRAPVRASPNSTKVLDAVHARGNAH